MNRRSFFKFLGASVAVAYAPSIAFKATPQAGSTASIDILSFLAGREFGMGVGLPGPYKAWDKYSKWTNEFLIENAREHLPKGTVVEIRACIPTDFGRSHTAAWYTNPKIAVSEPTGLHGLEINQFGGFFTAGTVRI